MKEPIASINQAHRDTMFGRSADKKVPIEYEDLYMNSSTKSTHNK